MTYTDKSQNADAHTPSAFAIPAYIREILDRFDRAGYEAWCVGGCVRDALRGTSPHDWDLCTNALPEQTLALFSDKPCLTVGIRHGTVTVMWEKQPVEITTYRCEGAYIGHRTPSSVTFTPSLREDCLRRDFTVNAMAYHPSRGLSDFFGGADDLRARLLRCVGDARERFDEDALRMMRALRFSSVLDFDIEPETAAAIHAYAPLLNEISGERISSEFRRMLTGVRAAQLLCTYADVIAVFYPPLAGCSGQLRVLNDAFAICHTAETRLAAAFRLCGCTNADDVRMILHFLPLDRAFSDAVTALVRDAALPPPVTRTDMRHALSRTAYGYLPEQLQLHAALFPDDRDACDASLTLYRAVTESGDTVKLSQLAVNGRDLAACGFHGPAIGKTLHQLLCAVMDDRVANTADALLTYAKTLSTQRSDDSGE
ncbi:MAG: hypothetical protein IJW77_18610 [Clostridia bacterium]|nr:hypothetical protein [Clostridia bacterium]